MSFNGGYQSDNGATAPVIQNASETVNGTAYLASQQEVNDGVDDTKIVTPHKLITRLNTTANRETVLVVRPENINPEFVPLPDSNKIILVNDTLALCGNIKLQTISGLVSFDLHILNLPMPSNNVVGLNGVFYGNNGDRFTYTIDTSGRLFMKGLSVNGSDTFHINFLPYVVAQPLQFYPTRPV